MDNVDTAVGSVLGALVGVYVVRVGIAGNGHELMDLLKEESKYLDFLLAAYALYLLHEYGPTHELVDQLMWAAFLAFLIKMVTSNTNLITALEDFGTGKRGLLDTLKLILGVS